MEPQVTNNYYYTTGRPGMIQRPQPKPIDWKGWYHKLLANRKAFFITMPVTFILACIITISIPNYYNVQVKLAPELGGSGSNLSGGLSSLMSSFGIGGVAKGGVDAVTPASYPDLMNSKTFLVSLFDIQVQSQDSTINTTYYEYLAEHQKIPWWTSTMSDIKKGIKTLFIPEEELPDGPVDPFYLTPLQDMITQSIGDKIVCDVDMKTAIITINVTDQDPLICARMADSACVHLQNFITDYRTKKARQELRNVQAQLDKTRREYEAAKNRLADFNDSNWSIVNEDTKLQQQFLQQDMALKYSAYSAFTTQLVSARTKLEESRPVYTVLDGASVPVEKSGPKRARTVLLMCFAVFALQAGWILRKELSEQFSTKPAPVSEQPAPQPTTQSKQ